MPRINRRIRTRKPEDRITRAQVLELLLGPNGASVFESPAAFDYAWARQREKLSPSFEKQWYAAGNIYDYTRIALGYCRNILAGHIPACLFVRHACQRHLNDLARILDASYPYDFDEAKANRVCRFIEMLPHVKGVWASESQRIKLEPWQIFILTSLFGWVKKSNRKRRFTVAYEEVARKNAKSTQAAGIALYMFACDGEAGAEVYSGATSEKQALEVFRPALQMMQRSPELAKALGVTIGAKRLVVPEDGSRFEPVVGKPGDGASPHCGVVDEYHEHDSDVLVDTFRTGMGARLQALLLEITTAGDNLAGPCKLTRDEAAEVLAGTRQRDELFAIIYTLDPSTDWSSEEALLMPNPNIGVSVFREFLITERKAALASARKQGVFKTKHQCVWVGANQAFFNIAKWNQLADRSLRPEMFAGLPCSVSIDLSAKNDLTIRVIEFKKVIGSKEHYYVFARCYIPQAQVEKPENGHYREWVASGDLVAHPGTSVDFEEIEREACEQIRAFKAREFAFDPWNAYQFAQGVQRDTRAQIVEIPQNTKMLNAPMKEVDVLMGEERIHHTGNAVLAWNIGNVVAHEDPNENVFPRKPEGREGSKIDGAVALIMAHGRLMVAPAKKSVYAKRGLLDIGTPPRQGAYA